MSHFLSAGKTGSRAPRVAQGINVQSSILGACKPVIVGVTRASVNFAWYADFQDHQPHSSGSSKGGGSTKGGKGGNPNEFFTVSFVVIICEGGNTNGAAVQVGPNVWVSQTETTLAALGYGFIQGDYAQEPWTYLETNYPGQAYGYSGMAALVAANTNIGNSPTIPNINPEVKGFFSFNNGVYPTTVPASKSLQVPRAVVSGTFTNSQGQTFANVSNYWGSDNGVRYTGGAALVKVGSNPGPGQYSVVDSTTLATAGTYTFNTADIGAAVTISFSYWGDADPSLWVALMLQNTVWGVAFTAPVGEVVSNDEPRTVPVAGPFTVTVNNAATFLYPLNVAYAGGGTLKAVLGTPSTGQYNVNTTTGVYTFAPGDHGASIKIRYASTQALLSYQAFCQSGSLMISPKYDTQQQASSALDDIAQLTYSEWIWDSGVFTVVPRGETAIAAWGFNYTPLAPSFNLTLDDFLPNSNATGTSAGTTSNDPLICTRKRKSDQNNVVKVEGLDRSNQYSPATAIVTDQAQLDQFKRRSTVSKTARIFSDLAALNFSAQLLMQKEQVRNKYSFECVNHPDIRVMDVGTVTSPKTTKGLPVTVRIIDITENDTGSFSYVAEEIVPGGGWTVPYYLNQSMGAQSSFNAPPGPINPPIFLDMPVGAALAAGGQALETWALVSGSVPATFGGADGFISTDGGVSYPPTPQASQAGATRMGVTTAEFVADGDPDTVDNLGVNLTESAGVLNPTTAASADAARTLSAILNRASPPKPQLSWTGYVGPGDVQSIFGETAPNMLWGYSTRALSAFQIGKPLATLRRASDNTTMSFNALGTGDIDQASIATFLSGTTGWLSLWNDQGPGVLNVAQATANLQPKYLGASLNGRAIFDFGANTAGSPQFGWLQSALSTWPVGGDVTVFAVCRMAFPPTPGGAPNVFSGNLFTLRDPTTPSTSQSGNSVYSYVATFTDNAGRNAGSITLVYYTGTYNNLGGGTSPPAGTVASGWDTSGGNPFGGTPAFGGASYFVVEASLQHGGFFDGNLANFTAGGNGITLFDGNPGTPPSFQIPIQGQYVTTSDGLTIPLKVTVGSEVVPGGTPVEAGFPGQLVELIVFPGFLTASMRSAIRQNIGAWYGITVTP